MRNKKLKLKNTFSNLSLLLYSQFSLPPPPSGAGGWEMGVHSQFMTCCLCCSFCLRGGLISPTPACGPSHGRQSSRNISNLSSSPGLHELLQCRFLPWGAGAVLQNRQLQHRFPPRVPRPVRKPASARALPWGHRICQEPAPEWAFHTVTDSFGHPPVLW